MTACAAAALIWAAHAMSMGTRHMSSLLDPQNSSVVELNIKVCCALGLHQASEQTWGGHLH